MTTLKALLVFMFAVGGVASQYSSNANKVRERMKLVSGGGGPMPTKPPPSPQASLFMDIHYSDPVLDGPYQSDTSWNPQGMGQLYSVTKIFFNWILPKDAYPDSLMTSTGEQVKFGNPSEHWQEWVNFYVGPVTIIAVGLAFIILLPLIGLFFCCCRCGGKCGARTKLEKPHDPCKRGTTSTFLLAVAVIILFGVVCAFVTNEQMKEGTESLIDNARTSLKDTELYLKNAKSEVDNLLVDNFQQLNNQLDSLLKNSGRIISEQLANASHAVVLSNLTDIAAGLEVVKTDLRDISESTLSVQKTAAELAEALDQTRDELLRALHECRSEPACRNLLQLPQIRELRVLQNFTQLPDVSRTFSSINSLVGNGSVDSIQKQVMEGQRSFDQVKNDITTYVQTSATSVNNSLEETGEHLRDAAEKIKGALNQVQNLLNHLAGKTLDQADVYIDEYAIYRYYLGLGISSALLLILFCISCGLLCGICGKRPEDLYSDDGDFCTTVAGARFLMIAVWLIFLLASIIMALTLALFLVGTATTIGICRPLADPANDKLFQLIDSFVDLDPIYNGKHVDINMTQIIRMCHQNNSMYNTFKIENVFNIEEVLNYKKRYQVEDQVRRFKDRVVVRTDRVQLLSASARKSLIDLAQSPVNDIQFSRYTDQLSSSLTNINLGELAQKLKAHADEIPNSPYTGYDVSILRRLLRTKAQFLELLQQRHVALVQEGVASLKANVSALRRHLKFNHTSLRVAVESLLVELDAAQRFLITNGTHHVRLLVDDFSKEFMDYVDQYLHRVVDKTKHDLARSGVLSNIYNSTYIAGCNRVADPFNGFWASVGWCLLLFIPALILLVKLSSLYHKSDAYTAPGIHPEAEYLYDAYADRDNMPLAVTQGDKKQNHHRSYQETYDNGGNGYLQDYSAHLSRTERPSTTEARFTDMAPKQWENQGPPRYGQPSATEYERPPPYYYPGPNER